MKWIRRNRKLVIAVLVVAVLGGSALLLLPPRQPVVRFLSFSQVNGERAGDFELENYASSTVIYSTELLLRTRDGDERVLNGNWEGQDPSSGLLVEARKTRDSGDAKRAKKRRVIRFRINVPVSGVHVVNTPFRVGVEYTNLHPLRNFPFSSWLPASLTNAPRSGITWSETITP